MRVSAIDTLLTKQILIDNPVETKGWNADDKYYLRTS
jgi:hypothetical protein